VHKVTRSPRVDHASSLPIRVVHLITDLDAGGAEIMLARLIETFDPAILENIVVSLKSGGIIAERIGQRARVIGLNMQPGRVNPGGVLRAMQVVRTLRPSVLQTWLYHADLVGLLAGTLARVPAIVWNVRCSALDPADYGPTLPLILRVLAAASRRPAAVVCNSFSGLREHERLGYRPRQWAVIPNGLDVRECMPNPAARTEVRSELGLSESAVLIGLVARMHPMKDHETFLRAASIIRAHRADVHFIVAGRGTRESEALRALVSDMGLAQCIHLLGEQRGVSRVLAALDIAVSSSASGEGFPNVVLEAMACGTPCVVTDTGDSAYVVGDTGRVVPPKNPAALANAVEQVLALNSAARQELGRTARARALSEFSVSTISQRYQDLYTELVGLNPIVSANISGNSPSELRSMT
jgi:glycosyltransferase involved in cell wall biosynthesis